VSQEEEKALPHLGIDLRTCSTDDMLLSPGSDADIEILFPSNL